jgi:quercetin 2,3-dioxygenase
VRHTETKETEMSNLETHPQPVDERPDDAHAPRFEALASREAELGPGLFVHRLLPNRARRLIGPWCFLDHFGPTQTLLDVPPHPHIGLQTVTWLFDGSVVHRDSIGSIQTIRPGQLNLMTAGRGIAHAELAERSGASRLHGLQLWVALPDADRNIDPAFEHHADLPQTRIDGVEARVFMGSFAGERSPARAFSPIAGAELRFIRDGEVRLPLDPSFEYGLLLVSGAASCEGTTLVHETLYALGTNREWITVDGTRDALLLLIGGTPFGESVLMWWNFVGRTSDEMAQARVDWEAGTRFGDVRDAGERLSAPPYALRVKPPRME